MGQELNPDQQILIDGLFRDLTVDLSEEQAKKIKAGMDRLELDRIASLLSSLHGTAPEYEEAKISLTKAIYYDYGIRDVLKGADVADEGRMAIVNRIARQEIARLNPERRA